MALERTFSILKPDVVRRNLIGQVLAKFEAAGLRPVALKKIHPHLASQDELVQAFRAEAEQSERLVGTAMYLLQEVGRCGASDLVSVQFHVGGRVGEPSGSESPGSAPVERARPRREST